MENINLKLENFEGPFDLLLKLVKINKMEISDISISDITNQYMIILKKMEELDLEIATEFFVMAATLIEIKSKELLPKKKDEVEDEIPDKDILLKKLKEYEFIKNAAYDLMGRYSVEEVIVTKIPDTIEEDEVSATDLLKGVTPQNLFLIYMDLLDRQKEKVNTVTVIEKKIHTDSFKIEDKMLELEEKLKIGHSMNFSEICSLSSGKSETIVYFLAVLELVRNHSIRVYQDEVSDDLLIEYKNEA